MKNPIFQSRRKTPSSVITAGLWATPTWFRKSPEFLRMMYGLSFIMTSSDYDDAISTLHEQVANGSCHGAAVLIWELLFAPQKRSPRPQRLQPTFYGEGETIEVRRKIIPLSVNATVSKTRKPPQLVIPDAQAGLHRIRSDVKAALASSTAAY